MCLLHVYIKYHFRYDPPGSVESSPQKEEVTPTGIDNSKGAPAVDPIPPTKEAECTSKDPDTAHIEPSRLQNIRLNLTSLLLKANRTEISKSTDPSKRGKHHQSSDLDSDSDIDVDGRKGKKENSDHKLDGSEGYTSVVSYASSMNVDPEGGGADGSTGNRNSDINMNDLHNMNNIGALDANSGREGTIARGT
jgi:hypothetical protein